MNCRFLRSKGTMAAVFWGCALFLVARLTARLFWRAAMTETGLSSLRLSWRDAVVGWAVGHYEPVNRREPVDQAEFWLRETDRVLARHPDDATLAMGAAMVLDSPGYEFVLHHVRELYISEEYTIPVLDEAGIERARDAFEERCKDRCLALAATATKLDPANPTWWRYYALLLCRPYYSTPRVSNWLEVLAQCARHDPDNALYDYLAAHFHWEAAGEIVFPDPERDSGKDPSAEPADEVANGEWDLGERLVISDPAEFERGVVRFNQGLENDHFSFHPDGTAPAFRFLARSRVPTREHPGIAGNRHVSIYFFQVMPVVSPSTRLVRRRPAS